MTDGPGPADAARGGSQGETAADPAEERFAAIMRYPRMAALISGSLFLVSLAVNLFVLEDKSGLLFVATAASALICILALWNVVNYSRAAMHRLKTLAPQVGGRFWPLKAGTGGYAGVPFAYGAEHERFGLLTYTVHDLQVEIGHLASQASDRVKAPTGRRHAYVVVRLPRSLPHMILSFGHLSKVFGVRVVPEQWHRSQLVDVGFGRRARLFVADGGEQHARMFFTPEMVQIFESVGRTYDVEIKGRNLYLFAGRSAAAGSSRRWSGQRALLEGLVAALAGSGVWELIRRQSGGRGSGHDGEIRADLVRGVTIVIIGLVVIIVVLSVIVLSARGLMWWQ